VARRYAPHRWQFDGGKKSRRIYVRPRKGLQSAHLWWQVVAKVQAASVPIAQATAPWDRQTDGRTDRLGRIALFQNAPYRAGHNNYEVNIRSEHRCYKVGNVPNVQNTHFTARCYASTVLAMGLCPSVRLCLCLSQAGVLLKRQNVGSHKQHHTIPQGL